MLKRPYLNARLFFRGVSGLFEKLCKWIAISWEEKVKGKIGKMVRRVISGMLSAGVALTLLSGCGAPVSTSSDGKSTVLGSGSKEIRIVSGSENKELEPVLEEYAKKKHVKISMTYMGSLDIMRELEKEDFGYDAVWPASSIWMNAGDTLHRVKHAESISLNPVVFGIKKSLAEELGFTSGEVSTADILSAITSGKLKFCMTSATQSNSGASAYMESSSADIFSEFLKMGMGAKPLVVGYESQILEFSVENPDAWQQVKDDIVMMYPIPTVWSSHVFIALDDNAANAIDALTDADVQKIAWEKHGFRTGVAGTSAESSAFPDIAVATDVTQVGQMPSYATMKKIIDYLR